MRDSTVDSVKISDQMKKISDLKKDTSKIKKENSDLKEELEWARFGWLEDLGAYIKRISLSIPLLPHMIKYSCFQKT